jgi:hypothetical protein
MWTTLFMLLAVTNHGWGFGPIYYTMQECEAAIAEPISDPHHRIAKLPELLKRPQ